MTVGGRMRVVRRYYKMNQTDFGARLGLSQAAIAGYENDSHSLSEQTIIHACKEFKINETWFRTGEGEMFVDDSDDFLSELSQKYSLNAFQQSIVRAVYDLPPEYQDMLLTLARRLVAENDESDHERTERIVNRRLDEYEEQQSQLEKDKQA